jgi:tetratricopeptide (TPR) repeat protein
MKRFSLLIGFTCLMHFAGAQGTNEQLIEGFSESYKEETAKDYDKAIAALKKVYSENSYETNLRLGWLYYNKKEYTLSATHYAQAMKLKPKSIEAMLGYVNPEAALQNWTNVLETYKKILAADPNNTVANYRIALMYYYRKDYGNTQAHLQKVLDLYPFDYESMLLMAQTKVATGKITEAKIWYEKVALYNPSDTSVRNYLRKL